MLVFPSPIVINPHCLYHSTLIGTLSLSIKTNDSSFRPFRLLTKSLWGNWLPLLTGDGSRVVNLFSAVNTTYQMVEANDDGTYCFSCVKKISATK